MIKKMLIEVFVHSWWVVAFILICSILYERGLQEREVSYLHLKEQLSSLKQERSKILELQQDLQLQINSQSDLAWQELTLKKGLGLVPENEQKVYFYQDSK